MNVITLESDDLIKALPEATLRVLREQAVKTARPLTAVIAEILREKAVALTAEKPAA